MTTTFNPQQTEAINALHQNIVVSASAGAGKTTVLIKRLMKRILEDNVSIDRICALTFTAAAANEMKTRLLAALYEKHKTDPSPYLSQQMMLVETAHITTIHSFCLSLIKDHGYLLGISDEMTQNILDPGMVVLYQKQAMEDLMHDWAIHRKDDLRILLQNFASKPQNTNALFSLIHTVSKYLNTKHNKEETIQFILNTYTVSSFNELPPSIKDALLMHHHLHISMILEQLQSLIHSVSTIENQEPYAELLLSYYEAILSIKTKIEHKDFSFIDHIFTTLDFKLKTIRKEEHYKACSDALADTIASYVASIDTTAKSIETLNQQAPLIKTILDFTLAYQQRFQDIKKEIQGLDFDDFERLAYALLTTNHHALANELKQQFDEIMVDEFQDTNDFQDAIIQCISNGHNIFRVGDVKQSIYRFRGAKPSIMQSLMKEPTIKNIYLSYNYRSKSDIVHFNNDFFSDVLNMTSGMSYQDHDNVDVGLDHQDKNSAPVEFLIVTDGEAFDQTLDTLPWDRNRDMRKARIIAQQVIQYHQQGYRFRDIVILVRSHAKKVFLKRAFEEANIPHFIDDRGGFYQSSIVASTLSFFRYILDETDYSLIQVLKSPFIGYSYDRLAQLKLCSIGNLSKTLKTFDADVFNMLQSFKYAWKHQDIVTSIIDIINLNDAYHTLLSIQDKTNIDSLLEKAITYQSSNNPNIMGFMDFINNIDDSNNAEAIPLSDNDDVVTAMTIHQSKGLQFPVVLLWSMGRRVNRDLIGSITTDDALGIAITDKVQPLNQSRSSLLKTLMKTKQDAEDLEETLRLVYVALTRAQERLVVIEHVKQYEQKELSQSLLYSYKHLMELLTVSHSSHREIFEYTYSDIPFKLLQPQEKPDAFQRFKKPQLKETVVEEIYHGSFTFNPHFIEATSYGNALHTAVENLPPRQWQNDDLNHIPPQFHKALITYNTNTYTLHLYQATQIHQELPFIADIDGITRNGIIDVVYEFDDKIVIVDFKTDNADEATLLERYTSQLSIYRKALETFSKPIETYIYSFHNNEYYVVK